MAVKDTEAFIDDDVAGIMVKFNPGSGDNVFSGYLLLLDAGGFASSVNNGLWRGNNNVFSMSGCVAWSASGHQCTKLVTNSSIRWTTKKWQHYKVEALGNTIRVYRWDTNSSASYTISDDYKIFEYTDTSSSALTYGTYGFWTLSQSGVQFRNFVSVTSYNDNYTITVS